MLVPGIGLRLVEGVIGCWFMSTMGPRAEDSEEEESGRAFRFAELVRVLL